MIESDRWDDAKVHFYKEGRESTNTEISCKPKFRYKTEHTKMVSSHGGSDFYTVHYFIEKILGRPDGEECIDIYRALDMTLPGLLAYRSICNGNVPLEVPNFRDKVAREKYRNDNWCTNPGVAGEKNVGGFTEEEDFMI